MTEPASRRGRPTLVKEPLPLDSKLLVRIHDLMVEARVLEERLIQMYRQGHGYFWIGGPGEEAFNVTLGLLLKKGSGLDYDFLHAHYRQSATLIETLRQESAALAQSTAQQAASLIETQTRQSTALIETQAQQSAQGPMALQ
mgnify:CR=1 FL=1